MKLENVAIGGALGVYVLAVLASIATPIALIIIAIHFIHKLW